MPSRFVFLLILISSVLLSGFGKVLAKETYSLPRITAKPTIDGELSPREWSQAKEVHLNYNINPGDSIAPPVQTIAYMMEDGENFYIAFDARDPEPEKILAYIRDRDRIFQDDFVGVILDTFNDERRGFEFFVNPLGSQGDLTRDDTLNNEDASWDTVWDSAGSVTETGYIVEMAIPFRALRYPPNLSKQLWGIQLLRIYPRDSRMVIADGKNNRELDCTLCQVNKVTGIPNLQSLGSNIDITPTLSYVNSEQRDVNPVGEWEQLTDEVEIGVDFRWAMTEDWILNATVNPDFSQVEADAGQLDVNTTFSLFYPEARPFFLDGADYFTSRNRLVHTRNIADPDVGLKVTGKTNGYSGGLIIAQDASTSFLVPQSLGSNLAILPDLESEVLIARGQMDLAEKSNIGALLTHRTASGYHNRVAAIDGKHYFTQNDVFNYQVMHSDSNNPDCLGDNDDCPSFASKQSDEAVSLRYQHNQEDYSFRAAYSDFGEDFRADLGFIGRVDYKQWVIGGEYIWRNDKGSKWTRWGVFGDIDRTEDQSGLMLEEEAEIHMFINGPMQFNTNFGLVDRTRYYDGEYFDETQLMAWFQIKPWTDVTLQNFFRAGDQVDFTHARLGEVLVLEPSIEWQIGKHFNLNLRYTKQTLDVEGGELFDANLMDLRMAYQFNVRSRLSLTLQTMDIDRNLALYEANQDLDPSNDYLANTKSLGTQLIYSYKINPQSLFYFGYSDNAIENDDVLSLRKTDKTIFAKFSYMWQH